MKVKFSRWMIALLMFVGAISVGPVVLRAQYNDQMPRMQGGGPQQGPDDIPQEKNEKAQPAPKVNKAEEDAYKALYEARNGAPDAQIQMCEAFVTKFPQSHYLSGVYATLLSAYYSVGNEEKMFAAGDKAIALNPDNVDALALLAMAIPRRVKADTPNVTQLYQKAETYGKHAIELVPNLPKPATVDDATFEKIKNDKLSMAHSGLGLIYLQRAKYDDARTELTQAVTLATNPDPVDYYLLADADTRTSYYNDAVAAYEKCALSGPLTAACKARIEGAKKDAATKMGR